MNPYQPTSPPVAVPPPSKGRSTGWLIVNVGLAVLIVTGLLTGIVGMNRAATRPGVGSEVLQPVSIVLEAAAAEQAAADQSGALMVQHYVSARLITERFLTVDFTAEPDLDQVDTLIAEAMLAWEDAAEVIGAASAVLDAVAGPAEGLPADDATPDGATSPGAASAPAASPGAFLGPQYPAVIPAIPALVPLALPPDPKEWAEEFTRRYDQTQGSKKLQTLAAQMKVDVKDVYEQLVAAQEIVRSGATKDAAFWDRMTKAALATTAAAKVGLFVGATIATVGGAAALAAPTAAGSLAVAAQTGGVGLAGAASIVINGVDAVVTIEATTSAIVLGEDHKLTAELSRIQDYTSPVAGATFVGFPDPTNLAGTVAFIGSNLTDYIAEGRVFGVNVKRLDSTSATAPPVQAPTPAGTEVTVTSIPVASDAEAIAGLAAVDLSLPPGQVGSLAEAIAQVGANLETARAALEALAEQIGVDLSGATVALPRAASAVAGTYLYQGKDVWGDDVSDFEPCQAVVTLDGTKMTISIDDTRNTTLIGTFDPDTGGFVGADSAPNENADDPFGFTAYQAGPVNLTFNLAADPITAEGRTTALTLTDSETGVVLIEMYVSLSFTRTGD